VQNATREKRADSSIISGELILPRGVEDWPLRSMDSLAEEGVSGIAG